MRPEVHVGAVGRVAAVELELVGEAGALFKGHAHARALEEGVRGVGHGLHEVLVVVVPDSELDRLGRFYRGLRLRRLGDGRGTVRSRLVRRAAGREQRHQQQSAEQYGQEFLHFSSSVLIQNSKTFY